MALTTYHYIQVGPSPSNIGRYVAGSVTVIGQAPNNGLDVQIDDTALADLDEFLRPLGYVRAAGTSLSWSKFTLGFADFSTAGLTKNVQLFLLQPKSIIHSVVIKHSAAFTGGLIVAYTISVGTIALPLKYALAFDVFQAPGATVDQVSSVVGTESFSASTSIVAQAVSVGANLDAATTGSVDIWVLQSLLP